jgi:hypothetical protein
MVKQHDARVGDGSKNERAHAALRANARQRRSEPSTPASRAAAKAEPSKIVFASAEFGATQLFSRELCMQTAGIKVVHVPFRNSRWPHHH